MSLTTCQYQWRLDGSWWLSTIKNFHTYIRTMRSDGVPSGWCTFSRSTFTCCTAMHIARGEGRDIARLSPPPPHLSPSWFHVHAPPLFLNLNFTPSPLNTFLNAVLNTCLVALTVLSVMCDTQILYTCFTLRVPCDVRYCTRQTRPLPCREIPFFFLESFSASSVSAW